MARPSVFSVEDKYRLVLAVVSGELTVAEAARRGKASEQSISTWKRQFLKGGKQGLADSGRLEPSPRERALTDGTERREADSRFRRACVRYLGHARSGDAGRRCPRQHRPRPAP